jgi:hypothetical protein
MTPDRSCRFSSDQTWPKAIDESRPGAGFLIDPAAEFLTDLAFLRATLDGHCDLPAIRDEYCCMEGVSAPATPPPRIADYAG